MTMGRDEKLQGKQVPRLREMIRVDHFAPLGMTILGASYGAAEAIPFQIAAELRSPGRTRASVPTWAVLARVGRSRLQHRTIETSRTGVSAPHRSCRAAVGISLQTSKTR